MTRRLPALALVCPLGFLSFPLAAEIVELPVERAVEAQDLELDLRQATVNLVFEKNAKPVLRARKLDPEKPGPVAIDLQGSGGALRIARAETEGQPKLPLRLELVLDPLTKVAVGGVELDVVVEAPEPMPGTKAASHGEGEEPPQPRLTFQVAESDIRLSHVDLVALTAASSTLQLDGTWGFLSLDLQKSSAEVRGHRGPVLWQSVEGDDVMADHQGDLELRLQGTRFQLRDSADQPVGEAEGGFLIVSGWRGTASIEARDATVEVVGSGGPETELSLKGVELQASVDQFEGALTAELRGGVLRGAGLEGETRITGRRGAAIDLKRLTGNVTLDLHKSTARLEDVSEKVEAMLHTAKLDVDGALRLEVKAEKAEVFAANLRRLDTMSIRETKLDLDLSRIEHNPALVLRGGSQARVQLPVPCSVRVAADEETIENQVKATGCDVRGRRRHGEPRELNPEGTTVMVVALEGDATLEVKSSP